ncbi:MAG: L-seryl-tRNA(Sec) selenium transferase [Planctomycetes bacterium]|nr:L-seryl-tRNA(Sec) selenium transferase [Planctomycetota bacterium]
MLRDIPSATSFLHSHEGAELIEEFGRGATLSEFRRLCDDLRSQILEGSSLSVPTLLSITKTLRYRLSQISSNAKRAVNATGILLHTGLGRSPLCDTALHAVGNLSGYSILQVDIEGGKRSLREHHIERMLQELTGCEAATVVNNNAAATMLTLSVLAQGKEVIVSRGQLVEIGGSFRMPDVMAYSGCTMVEVGTTNRTHLHDYEQAINDNTAALIHVHTSNYRIRGFHSTPGIDELCELGAKRNIPVIDDVGSGSLIPLFRYGIMPEPLVVDSIRAGADLTCFSGDKLMCGPQSGIIIGSADWVAKVRRHPLARMFRVCKLTLAALENTLIHFINDNHAALPLYQALDLSLQDLNERADTIEKNLNLSPQIEVRRVESTCFIGSGTNPDEGVPSVALTFQGSFDVNDVARLLRGARPALFCRIHKNALYFDMRSLRPGEENEVCTGLRSVFSQLS